MNDQFTPADASPARPAVLNEYEKPAITWEETVEVRQLAVSCAHFSGQNNSCNSVPSV